MKKGKEILLGIIFILTIVLLYGGISFLKGRNLFSSNQNYYVRFHNVSGLSNSSPIYLNGVRIGIVNAIHYNYSHPDDIVVRIGINKNLRIPEGSRAMLVSDLLGTVNVRLDLAPDAGRYHLPGDTLSGQVNTGIRSQIAEVIPQLVQIFPKVDSILTSVNKLVQDPSIPHTIHNAETLTDDAKNTLTELSTAIQHIRTLANTYQGIGNQLDTFAGKLNTLSEDERLNTMIANLDVTLRNLRSLSDDLAKGDGMALRLISDSTLYSRLNTVCDEASNLISDIKKNPSRYIRILGRPKE